MSKKWLFPANGTTIKTIDAHAAGEPLRIIVAGLPPIPGKTMLEKRRYAKQNLDDLRTALMWEPRGHADMYGCIVTEPVLPDSQLGALFLHNEGFSTMCGHGIIALATVVAETGMIKIKKMKSVLKIDTPAGQIAASMKMDGGKVSEVLFLNVPSFVSVLDHSIKVSGVGEIPVDVAFGGAFYAFCRADDLGVRLYPEDFRRLIDLGMKVKRAVMDCLPIRHPLEDDLSFLYGTIIVGPPQSTAHHSRNVCVFADGEVDRSPTGTGVSARAAIHYARGDLAIGQPFVVESILGTRFTGRVVEVTRLGSHDAVIPEVSGSAYILGQSEFLLNPRDPLCYGFMLR
jgi:proline racemase